MWFSKALILYMAVAQCSAIYTIFGARCHTASHCPTGATCDKEHGSELYHCRCPRGYDMINNNRCEKVANWCEEYVTGNRDCESGKVCCLKAYNEVDTFIETYRRLTCMTVEECHSLPHGGEYRELKK